MATQLMTMKMKVRTLMATLVSLIFAGLLCSLIFVEVPGANADILKVLVGFVGGSFVSMISFYFGDSEGKDVG